MSFFVHVQVATHFSVAIFVARCRHDVASLGPGCPRDPERLSLLEVSSLEDACKFPLSSAAVRLGEICVEDLDRCGANDRVAMTKFGHSGL